MRLIAPDRSSASGSVVIPTATYHASISPDPSAQQHVAADVSLEPGERHHSQSSAGGAPQAGPEGTGG